MKKLVLVGLLAAAVGCQNDNKNIERKLDLIIQKLDRQGGAAPRAQRPEPDRSKTYAVPIDGDPFDGPADAKVTLVKAYDYACPYCEKVRGTMADLEQKYGKDLRVVYKQLVVHPKNAMAGALAFCAAGKQGKHKEMDKLLWDKGFKGRQMDMSDVAQAEAQQQPDAKGGAGKKCWDTEAGCANVVGFAQEIGLDVNKFKADMKGECMQVVQKDMAALQQLGVAATPGFFINGRFLSGAMPIENFVTLIDEELKKANEKIQQGTPQAEYYKQWVLDKGLKSLQPSG
ncbi:MAG TPA: thioredoxin domain-containing protein [Kofleriaceae bacterium]|nr:thioredoxin domain-containing protein [Kofleriaceae bacterium]